VIRPAIERKQIVICDRYFYSSIAFQGHGRGLPVDQVTEINHIAVDGELPDAVILLDLDPAIGLERTSRRGAADGADAFEAETLAFHERIRSGFQKMAKEREESFVVIDAAQSASAVFNEAWEVFEKLLTARAHA
jgi:dTMP kinase